MKVDVAVEYVSRAPLALALERLYEIRLLRAQEWRYPILDVGCGDGIFASICFDRPVDYGIDPNEMEISRATQSNAYLNLTCGSAAQTGLPADSIGTAFSNSVLEHIDNLSPVLAEIFRVLEPGGRFFVTVPSDRFESYSVIASLLNCFGMRNAALRFRAWYNRFWVHYHCYNEQRWSELFAIIGFNIRSVEGYISPSRCLLHDFLVPFALPSFLARRFLKRWFFVPELRRYVAPLMGLIAVKTMDRVASHPKGGLLFFVLEKPKH